MKNILIYVDNDWALGSIHNELIKHFYLREINANLLFWGRDYSSDELFEINEIYDSILTTPHGYIKLRQQSNFLLPQEKFIVIAHAVLDLDQWFTTHAKTECCSVKSFGVVSKFLQDYAIKLGYPKKPDICNIGININNLNTRISNELKIIGYGSTYHDRNSLPIGYENQPAAKKRSYLVKDVADLCGLQFKIAQKYHNSYVTMSGFYNNIDALIMPSSEEGAGLPALEAAAAGRLVISTPVGHIPDLFGKDGIDIVSIDEIEFISQACDLINMYKSDNRKYKNRCLEIQENAKKLDWKYKIDSWINML